MDFHRERATGELLAHADSDVNTATMVLRPLAFAVSVVVLVGVTMLVLLLAHPLLALIAAVVFPRAGRDQPDLHPHGRGAVG